MKLSQKERKIKRSDKPSDSESYDEVSQRWNKYNVERTEPRRRQGSPKRNKRSPKLQHVKDFEYSDDEALAQNVKHSVKRKESRRDDVSAGNNKYRWKSSYKKFPAHIDEILSKKNEHLATPVSPEGITYPLGFKSYKDFKRKVQPFLNRLYKFDKSATIAISGSSIQGYKFMKKSGNLWFDNNSDYDLSICSLKLFNRIEKVHPASIYKGGHRTYNMPRDLKDKIVKLYDLTDNWPRPVHINFYRSMTVLVDYVMLVAIIEVDSTTASVCGTYLIGDDIIAGTPVGDRRLLLQKYGELPIERRRDDDRMCSIELNKCLEQKILLQESTAKFDLLRENVESFVKTLLNNSDAKSVISKYKTTQTEIDKLINVLMLSDLTEVGHGDSEMSNKASSASSEYQSSDSDYIDDYQIDSSQEISLINTSPRKRHLSNNNIDVDDAVKLKDELHKELTITLAKELKEHLTNEISRYFNRECDPSDHQTCFKLVRSENDL